MKVNTFQLRRALHTTLLVLLLSAVGMTKVYASYDFSAVCETGQTLYYNIIDSTNHYVELTYPGVDNWYGWSGFTEPKGSVILSENVPYNGIIYTVTSIGNYAFYNCDLITSITISGSVTTIGSNAFNRCLQLSSAEIPNSVTFIDFRAFEYCYNLTSIEIPNSVTSIGSFAFNNCSRLTSIEIPNSVLYIGYAVFSDCTGLEQIIVDSGNAVYDSRENCNAIIKTGINELVTGCKNTIIPSSVTSISSYAFYGCTGLTSIEIPNFVTSIENYAFYDCTGLTSIVSFAETPPALGQNSVFYNVNTYITVYVPCNSTEVYSSNNWGGFSNFMGICAGEITATVYPIGSGIVSGTGSYEGGATCTLAAMPNEGFSFFNWTKDGEMVSNSEAYSFLVAGDASFVANFVQGVAINFADSDVKAICVANWDTNSDGELSYAEAAAVTNLGEVFRNNSIITSFNELQYFTGLTSIGSYAFERCSGLNSIRIPNSVTTIGNWAFSVCSSLTMIELPNSVTSIGQFAFYYCTSLTSIVIPNSVTSIEIYAFSSCSGLEQIIVEPGNAYYDSRENSNAIIRTDSNSLVTGCKNTVIPNSVTSIGPYAFEGCSGLTTIIIPNSVSFFGNNPFKSCDGLVQIVVDSGNTVYDSRDNCNAVIKSSTNELIIGCKNTVIPNSVTSIGNQAFEGLQELTTIAIPNSVTSIGGSAFQFCRGLTGILTIPNSVTTIGSGAFNECSGLTGNLIIPNSVTTIGGTAFQSCSFTGNLIIPNSITRIEDYTFNMCWYFTSVEIPETVTFIGERAFACWYGMQSMTVLANNPPTLDNKVFINVNKSIPVYVPVGAVSAYQAASGWNEFTNIQEIESSPIAFADVNVKALCVANWDTNGDGELSYAEAAIVTDLGVVFRHNSTIISFDELQYFTGLTYIGYAFDYCNNLTTVAIPNSVTTIGGFAFYHCSGLTSITIPNSVTSIGTRAFSGCISLTSVIIPNSVTSISNAFYDCSGLISIIIPSSVTSMGSSAFGACPNLEQIIVESDNPVYDSRDNCNAIIETNSNTLNSGCKNTIIPNSVTSIGTMAFRGCTGLTSITIPNSVTSIGQEAFESCSVLDFITIPNSVTSIGNSAFSYCEAMTSVSIGNSVASIGHQAFANCIGLASMTVLAETSPSLGNGVFYNVDKSIPVFVPCGSVEAYQNAPGWNEFTNIQEDCTQTQAVALSRGWNWYSTYIEQEGIDGLGQLENSIGVPKAIIQSQGDGYVKSILRNGRILWGGALTSINNEEMYKIGTKYICTATMEGVATDPASHPITINKGWNWIGFPCGQNVNLNVAMSGFTPKNGDVIKGIHSYATFSNGTWSGTLNTLEPGQGYMYGSRSNASKTLVYQTGRGDATIANITPENNFFQPTDDYADNMTLTAIIELDGEELRSDGYELAAFVGDECRGSVRLMYVEPVDRYVAFLTVFGEQEEDLHFRLTDGVATNFSTDCLAYTTDGILGALDNPVVLHFGLMDVEENASADVKIYPNPSEGLFNVDGQNIRKVEVFNAFGQLLYAKDAENGLMMIDLTNRASGIYLIRVVTDNGILNRQVMKR